MYSEELKQRLGHVDTEWVRVKVDPSVGCRYEGTNCPVFHALDGADFPVDGVDGIYVHWLGDRPSSRLPDGAINFVHGFDSGVRVKPIELLVNPQTLEIKDA